MERSKARKKIAHGDGEGEKEESRGRRWCWRFGKRTVEKPLDSYERENSTESRQTDRRWLRLTGFATTLPFLPHRSSCSLIPLFPPFILLLSFRHWCVILWLPPYPDQLCFSNSPAIHYARPAGMTLNTHRDPKQVPHTRTHTAVKGSHMTEGGVGGGQKGRSEKREPSVAA